MKRRPHRRRDERGVEVVEFAIIVPVLLLIVFGLIDFGWAFSQNLDVKHSAREAARLASVSATADCPSLIDAIKSQMTDINGNDPNLKISITTVSEAVAGPPQIGDTIQATITYPLKSLSGLTSAVNGGNLTSSVQIRMEQASDWGQTCS